VFAPSVDAPAREILALGETPGKIAQRAAAGGDVSAALAVLDDAARGGNRSTLVDEARRTVFENQNTPRERYGCPANRCAHFPPWNNGAFPFSN
jgi:hypothetical protein